MTLSQILTIVKARWTFAVYIFLFVVGSAAIVTLCLPREYSASASVVVDVKTDPLSTSIFSEETNLGYLGTQVEIAGSERVALRALQAVGLDEMPKFQQKWRTATDGKGDYDAWLARWMLKRVTVKPVPLSNVIDISVRWPDAKMAATLANAFAQAYIDVNVALKVQMGKEYAARFDERARVLRADLEAKQKALSDFEQKSGIVATDEKMDVEQSRLNELSTELVSIQAKRQESQSLQRQSGRDGESIAEVLQNPLVTSLKTDLSKAEARKKDLETSLGVNHPAYLSAEAEVNSLRERLDSESAKIISSFSSSTQVNEQREAAIRQALDTQRSRILSLQHLRDQAAVLQNDVVTAQRNLDTVSQRLAQSNLEGATDQTNIGLLTSAAEPSSISSPKYWIILGVAVCAGLFLGVIGALLRELSDQRVRSDEILQDILGVPNYGTIVGITYPARDDAAAAIPRLESPAI
jgi:chain length determinant protein EpsF